LGRIPEATRVSYVKMLDAPRHTSCFGRIGLYRKYGIVQLRKKDYAIGRNGLIYHTRTKTMAP